jgi:putative ABC transport system permease protein
MPASPWRAIVDGIGHDVRYAIRLLGRSPGFAAVAIASLALGIGANAAVFSVLNAIALRSIGAPHPEQLVSLNTIQQNGGIGGLSSPMLETLGRDQRVFSSLTAEWGGGVLNLEANGRLRPGTLWAVTGNFYAELGAIPAAGRLLADSDVNIEQRRPEMVAVLGYGMWLREFGGEPSALGQSVKVEGVPFSIVGVAPRGFTAFGVGTEPDVTIPLTAYPIVRRLTTDRFRDPKAMWLDVVGRLKPDIGLHEARNQLEAMWPRVLTAAAPPGYTGSELEDFKAIKLDVQSAARGRGGSLRSRLTRPLASVLGVAALILLIACVNLASLMISRAAARSHELSVRMALGAQRWRLTRQMLVEGLLLSSVAAALGLLLAAWTGAALKAMMTRDWNVPSTLNVSPDGRVLAFTVALAILAGVLFTTVPAWWTTRRDPASSSLLQSARSVTSTARTGKVLIVAEVALSVMLLMVAVLLVRTLQRLNAIDVGFRRAHVSIASRFPTSDGYRNLDVEQYYRALHDRVAALPGVSDAAVLKLRPGDGSRYVLRVAAIDGTQAVTAYFGLIGPGVFRLLDMPLLAGRDVGWSDNSGAPRVAIVSQSLAARMFPGRDPLGGRLRIGADPLRGDPGGEVQVIGVVRDVRLHDPRDPNASAVYLPMLQDGYQGQSGDVLVRSAGSRVNESDVRRAIESFGRETVLRYRTLEQVNEFTIVQERVTALLAGFFGGLALALSAIGLYGLMAYAVVQRTRELAIRRVLGAQSHDVVRMVVREATTLVVAGIAIGLPLALISGRIVRSLLFGLTPSDPISLVLIAAMLLGVGLLAGYLPGRRASRVQPMDALRT